MKCPKCGAEMILERGTHRCEYCGESHKNEMGEAIESMEDRMENILGDAKKSDRLWFWIVAIFVVLLFFFVFYAVY